MRKLFVCAGLALAGTASLHATYAPDLNSMQTTKMWSVAGTLRGFYDDNYNTAPDGPNKLGSAGFEISPQLDLNVPLQQTEIGLRYIYGLYYYQNREDLGQKPIDQTQQVNLWVDHAFTERWQGRVQDNLAVGQDPQLVQGGTLERANGNNIHNDGALTLNTQWSRLLGTSLVYENNFYDYQDDGGNAFNPSLAGLLNRLQNDISLDVNWRLQPTLVGFVGYKYEQINYIGDEPIGPAATLGGPAQMSDSRDNRSQYVYVGGQYTPLDNLNLLAKVGLQYTDWYNPAAGYSTSSETSPYAVLSGTYTYLPGSYVQMGFYQSRNATDVTGSSAVGQQVTQDQNSSTVYGTINHAFTPRLIGSANGQVQYSKFYGGTVNGESQSWYSLGLNLMYVFNPHLSADIGYNYDNVTTISVQPGYDRNRVYVGVTGTY
jgi:Putative beta-barrel porin 2